MSRCFCLVLAVSLAWTGSNFAFSENVQPEDANNPFLKQAQQDLDNNKPGEAAAEYEDALTSNPRLATAEYQLGILYSDKLQDPIAAIYHLKLFCKLAPNSERVANAQQLIDKESHAFAATVPSQNGDQLAKLQSENGVLKKQIDDAAHTITLLQGQLAQANKIPAPAATAGEATGAAPVGPQKALPLDQMNPNVAAPDAAASTNAAPPAGSRTYTVVKGDKIWTIAKKMYPGHTKEGVDKIQDANKDSLGNKPLKIGQVLVIPN